MAEIDRWALERACWAGGIALVCGLSLIHI